MLLSKCQSPRILTPRARRRVLILSYISIILIWLLPFTQSVAQQQLRHPPMDVTANRAADPIVPEGSLSGAAKVSRIASGGQANSPLRQNAYQIGTTRYDLQQNTSMGRQIVSGGGWIHHVWTNLQSDSLANRSIAYWGANHEGTLSVESADIIPSLNGLGFANIGFDANGSGRAVVSLHSIPTSVSLLAVQAGIGVASFSHFPLGAPAANCGGIVTGPGTEGPYFWPKIAVDYDALGKPLAHVVATEYRELSLPLSLVYYRTEPELAPPALTCARFIDTVTLVSSVVCEDPGSDKVAIVWLRPVDWSQYDAGQQRNNDVVYVESENLGQDWGTVTNVTNYSGTVAERAFADLSALYTSDGCLHILFNAIYFDSATQNFALQSATLYHWDDCAQCKTLVQAAFNYNAGCSRGVWHQNISKMNLSECSVGEVTRLYATYTKFLDDYEYAADTRDCSQAGYANGEIFLQASANSGATWGPPVNLTQSYSNECAAGDCASENFASAALYSSDSLRIQYLVDRDAGSAVYSEGIWTNNSVMYLSYPCIGVDTYYQLTAQPHSFLYPFHSAPGAQLDTTILLINSGNAPISYLREVYFESGINWLSFPFDPPNGALAVACNFLDTVVVRINAPEFEGLYEAVIRFIYLSDGVPDTLRIPVELYCFEEFILPQDQILRTATNRLSVNQAGRVGNYRSGQRFNYFSEISLDYLRDASLILGTAADSLSWLIYGGAGGAPTASNPYGSLYATTPLAVDSVSNGNYIYATGTGVNRDSSIAFVVEYFAPKLAAFSDCYLAKFSIAIGPNNQGGRVDNLTAAFAVDWDIPASDGASNFSGHDKPHQLVYQRGSGSHSNRFGGLAVRRLDGQTAAGGFVWDNDRYVNPLRVYENDSLWTRLESATTFSSTSVVGDLNSVVVAAQHHQLSSSSDTLKFLIILAAQQNGSVNGLLKAISDAWLFYCLYVDDTPEDCPSFVCGDADGSGLVTISDGVYLINFIFGGGPAPNPLLAGDNDCSGIVTISDAVYLINFIFAGGPAPCASC